LFEKVLLLLQSGCKDILFRGFPQEVTVIFLGMIDFSGIKALVFDFGGVLINLDKQRCIDNLYRITGYDFSNMVGNYLQAGFFLKLEKGLVSEQEFYNEVRKYSRFPVADEQIRDAWISFLLDVPIEKKKLLLALHKKYRVYMLSNTNAIHVNYCMPLIFDSGGYSRTDYFDKCYLSNEIHMAKPDREIFEFVLADSGLNASECLFLDDGKVNIEVAASLGFQTYLTAPYEDLRPLFEPAL
jgi:putative hydrolase of the HAD superfamily